MHSNNLKACGKKGLYSWFNSEVRFLVRFAVYLDLSHFGVF